ncbi:MAG TPA: hypothetical protein VNM50_07645, partial [Chloroflexota bacterium]|nr:hypothetical protein [Chloroflexota bacterium]
DRAAVDVYCYVARRCTDEIAARLGRATDHWRSIVHLDDDAAAALIRADQIDVLVDLAGHSGFNRLLVSARKPAPVQALWLGYFDTTGMSAMARRAAAQPAVRRQSWTSIPARLR